jgi:hypothetical protein
MIEVIERNNGGTVERGVLCLICAGFIREVNRRSDKSNYEAVIGQQVREYGTSRMCGVGAFTRRQPVKILLTKKA